LTEKSTEKCSPKAIARPCGASTKRYNDTAFDVVLCRPRRDQGFEHDLTKPINIDEVTAALNHVLAGA